MEMATTRMACLPPLKARERILGQVMDWTIHIQVKGA